MQTLGDLHSRTPIAICRICHTGIYAGEPVVTQDSGLAHRFKQTCEYEAERVKKYDEDFLKDLKISEPTD